MRFVVPVGLALFLVVGCGPSRMARDHLEVARKTYAQAQADPNVKALAPSYLEDATKEIKMAEAAGGSSTMIHRSYLAEKKSQIAMAVAEGKAAEREIQRLNAENADLIARKQELDRKRELEKQRAQLEAERARMAAETEAERAAQAKKEAEQARMVAAAEEARAAQAKKEAEQARIAAEQARMAAKTEAERAAAAKQEAEAARKQAEAARLAAQVEAERAAKAQADADQLMRELSDLKAKQTERGIVLTIGEVLFAFDKADLSLEANRNVGKLADFLKKYTNRNVLIEGHTDSVGSDDYNIGLSKRRSDSVKDRLMSFGVEAGRITSVGYGEKYPAFSNDTPENRALNRRVEVIILNEGVKAETQIRK